MTTFSIYNSLTKQKEAFIPLQKNTVRMYTCGPTVYGRAHIGNLYAMLCADMLYRWLRFGEGYSVDWRMNITDIDDKTIKGSGMLYPESAPLDALIQYTRSHEDQFKQDLESLHINGVSEFIRATDTIDVQQDLVRRIVEAGHAYVRDGSVYFSLHEYTKHHDYGKFVHIPEIAVSRIDNDEYDKDSASDFVLWKASKQGEPSWDFELHGQMLPGRPGWHLECSAIEHQAFGLPFDIHTGGIDLQFPHHENEVAQSCSGYGVSPTTVFVHNGHVLVDGQKMSKSLGNVYTLEDLKQRDVSIEAFRFVLLSQHYRGDTSFEFSSLSSFSKHLSALRSIRSQSGFVSRQSLAEIKDGIVEAMRNDMNTPQAIAALLQIRKPGAVLLPDDEKELFFQWVDQVFGIDTTIQASSIPEPIEQLAADRWTAKQARDFAEADRLRDEIAQQGYTVVDKPNGYEVVLSI